MPLREFLNENTTRSSDEATHYGMKPTTGMWKIEPEAMSTFLPHYRAAVFENGEQWAIVEKAKPPVSIVKIDIDLKYTAPDADHEPVLGSAFQQGFADLVAKYTSVMFDRGDIDNADIVIMRRPTSPTVLKTLEDGTPVYKDGLHVYLPLIVCEDDVQLELVDQLEGQLQPLLDAHTPAGATVVTKLEDVLDKCLYAQDGKKHNGLMMHGSTKEGAAPYELAGIWQVPLDKPAACRLTEEQLKQYNTDYQLLHFTSLRTRNVGDANVLTSGGRCDVERRRKHVQMMREAEELRKKEKQDWVPPEGAADKSPEAELVCQLLQCVSPDRARGYDDWFQMLCVFAHSAHEHYDIFDQWSQQYGGCTYDWLENQRKFEAIRDDDKYQGRKRTLGSLYHWAKSDDPEKYEQLLTDKLIEKHWLDGHSGVSIIAAHFMRRRFVCSDCKHGSFWVCDPQTNLWKQTEHGLMLKELRSPIGEVRSWIARKQKAMEDSNADSDVMKAFAKQVGAFWKNSADTRWKELVVKELKGDLYDDEFVIKLDMLSRVYSAANGLVDCTTGELRACTPEDFCSRRSNVAYNPKADTSALRAWLTDVFTNHEIPDTEQMVECLQLMMGGSIAGMANELQLPAVFFTGTGGNGKGVLLSIWRKLFDGFNESQKMSEVVDGSIICGTTKFSGKNSATPELAKLQGKRLASIDELEKEDNVLNKAFKNMVGSDDQKVTARHLFQNSVTFIMNIVLLIACNKMPAIPTNDGDVNSFLRRMLVFPFKNDYKDDQDMVPYNAANPNHRWKDPAKCRAVTENMSGVLLFAVEGAMKLIAKGRLGAVPETCRNRLQQASSDSNWVDKFEFCGDTAPAGNGREVTKHVMKVKEIKEYITGHFGFNVSKSLTNAAIIDTTKALGCWHKVQQRVDTIFAIRIKGSVEEDGEDQPKQHQEM